MTSTTQTWRRRITRLVMVALAGVMIVLGGGQAAAQDDGANADTNNSNLDQAANDSNWSEAYQGCINRAADQWAEEQLMPEDVTAGEVGNADPDGGRTNAMRQGQRQEDNEQRKEEALEEIHASDEFDEKREEFLAKGNNEIVKLAESFGCGARQPLNWVGEAVSDWWDSPFGKFIQMVKDGNPQIVVWTMTIWQEIDFDPEAITANANGVSNIVWKFAIYGFGLSFLIGLVKVASKRDNGAADGLMEAARGYARYLGFGVIAPALMIPLMMGFDAMANTVMENWVLGGDSIEQLAENAKVGEDLNPFLVALLIIPAFFGSAAMAILLVFKPVIMALLLGAMPLIAAWNIGRPGRSALDTAFGAMLSFTLLKLITALFYAAAVWTVAQNGDSDQSQLLSAVIIGMSALGAGTFFKMMMSGFSGVSTGPSPAQMAGAAALATGAVASAGAGALGAAGGAAGAAGGGLAKAGAGAAQAGAGAAKGMESATGSKGSKGGSNPSSQSRSTGLGGSSSTPSTGEQAPSASAAPSGSDGGSSHGGQSAPANNQSQESPSTGNQAESSSQPQPTKFQRVTAATGRGIQAAGHGTQAGSKVLGRVAQNSIQFSNQAMNVSQGLSDGTVGSSTHPGR